MIYHITYVNKNRAVQYAWRLFQQGGNGVKISGVTQGHAVTERRRGRQHTRGGDSFTQTLQAAQLGTPVRFSGHAADRLAERHIALTDAEQASLVRAADQLAAKGVKEAFVHVPGKAVLILSVPKRIVVTAVDGASMRERIFTNIDSAVILSDDQEKEQ